MPASNESFWVPEHPRMPMYRVAKPTAFGKLHDGQDLLTASIHDAMQFKTRAECEAWIAANPVPAFFAREHVAPTIAPKDGSNG
jgi:hypothetical protein